MDDNQAQRNKMAVAPVCKLIWKMGLPMIISMVLQAVYNIVDTAFVINMGEEGVFANLALTYAFPVQLLIIAIGVGTGVGINSLLSQSLGQKNKAKSDKVVGNGIFLAVCIYVAFLLFGIFGARPFVEMQAKNNPVVAKMGGDYLTICCCFSFGAIGFTVYERFLQSTGKTLLSTIAQICGAVTNIVLDFVFIFPLKMGIAGAAWATVIGQILSLAVAMALHYFTNKELGNNVKNIVPSAKIIKEIYHVGLSAMLMQGLLSVMMFGVNVILGYAQNAELLQGSFGIYYKIMQFALFTCFGLSNTIISVLSFNFGMKDKKRSVACAKWGVINTLIASVAITVLFQCLAVPLANLFSLVSGGGGAEIKNTVVIAIRIASLGYVYMGFSVAVQGILQALRCAISPLVIALLRLAVFVFPTVWLFSLSQNATSLIWWAFPVAELHTAVVSAVILARTLRKKIGELPTATVALPQQ
ncbi:MAG: MATE family efflux transporter [Candidatus Fimimonas sp.]